MKTISKKNKMNKKAYFEAINRCRHILSEKRLSESTFEDTVAEMKDKLIQIQNDPELKKVIGLNLKDEDMLELDPTEDLNTSEEDLNPENGSLTEKVKAKRLALKEAAGFSSALKRYIADGGTNDFDSFLSWLEDNNLEDVVANTSAAQFRHRFKQATGGLGVGTPGIAATAGGVPHEELAVEPADPSTYSNELNNLIEICNNGEQIIESAADTVKFKYRQIHSKLKRVILGKSLKNYYLLMGDAGIGKSYIVRETLDALGYGDVPQITGSVGKSPAPIAAFLYQHRDDPIVILDDCDTMISKAASKDVSNMLKGAMDPDRHHVTISPTIVNLATSFLKEGTNEKYKGDRLFESEEDLEDAIASAMDVASEGGDVEDEEFKIPTDFDFNARIVFISNLDADQVNEAIISRCDWFELHLTVEEYMVRLGLIISNIDCGQSKGIYTEEEVLDAKALLMATLAGIIDAGKKGVSLFGKRVVLKKGGLEFRLVKDLVENYIITYQDLMEENPSLTLDQAKKACVRDWIRQFVIPRVSA